MNKRLVIVPMALLVTTLISMAKPSDEVTFKTTSIAPSGFNSWTFFWKMPVIDPGAKLEYVVLQPDGKEYFRYSMQGKAQAGDDIRSDFMPGFAGGDPSLFWNREIAFKFIVNKGKINFRPDSTFRFEFRGTIPAVQE